MNRDEEITIPHVTRHDGAKTAVYVVIGLIIAIVLLVGTFWLLLAN
jgi:heme/copper-type cytochrome/quinol oxidase subunit 4